MMYLYAIYDKKAHMYMNLVNAAHDAIIERQFCDLTYDKDIPLCKYPKDFELHRLGSFDEKTGVVTPEDITIVARASDYFMAQTASSSENNVSEVKVNENFQ